MGWFWADAPTSSGSVSQATKPPHHPHMMAGNADIPPECPMHRSKGPAAAAPPPPPPPSPTNNVLSTTFQSHSSDAISDLQQQQRQHTEPTESRPWSSYLNPLNMMPKLSNTPAPQQKSTLPISRVISSIPKGTHPSEGNWEYPSPQQMYNAMIRKGYDDTPEDAVEDMVDVHNFLNEGAWQEIVGWERQFAGGLWRSVKIAGRGGGNSGFVEKEEEERAVVYGGVEREVRATPRLLRFQGRPQDLSPKARMYHYLGKVFPQFGNMPFDRHDWYVQRSTSETEASEGQKEEVRYVIDYYSGESGPTGESIFYLDVRPAIDRPRALFELGIRYGGEVWWKASGGAVREEERQRRQMEQEARL